MESEGTGGGGDVGNNLKKFLYKGEKKVNHEKKNKKPANRKQMARPGPEETENILLWKLLNTSQKYHGPSYPLR